VKHSSFSGVVAWSGGSMVLRADQRFDDDHPIVKERPDLFRDGDTDAGVVKAPKPASVPVVERATAAPGEVRDTPGTGPRGGNRVPKAPGQ